MARGQQKEVVTPGNNVKWDFFADHLLGDRQTGADILEKNNAPR